MLHVPCFHRGVAFIIRNNGTFKKGKRVLWASARVLEKSILEPERPPPPGWVNATLRSKPSPPEAGGKPGRCWTRSLCRLFPDVWFRIPNAMPVSSSICENRCYLFSPGRGARWPGTVGTEVAVLLSPFFGNFYIIKRINVLLSQKKCKREKKVLPK